MVILQSSPVGVSDFLPHFFAIFQDFCFVSFTDNFFVGVNMPAVRNMV